MKKAHQLELDLSLTQIPESPAPSSSEHSQIPEFHFRNIIQQASLVADKNGRDFKITQVDSDFIVLEEVNGSLEYDFGEGIVLRKLEFERFFIFNNFMLVF